MARKTLPKGFLTSKGNPTNNAVTAYLVYLSFLPTGWNTKKVYQPAVDQVRKFFGVDYGFDVMIKWGIQHGCGISKTSSGRHESMSDAYTLARTLLGAKIVCVKSTIS